MKICSISSRHGVRIVLSFLPVFFCGLFELAAKKPEQQHHFWPAAGLEGTGTVPAARQRRLVRELRSLARELPLYWGSTVALRVDEDCPHLLKVTEGRALYSVVAFQRWVSVYADGVHLDPSAGEGGIP